MKTRLWKWGFLLLIPVLAISKPVEQTTVTFSSQRIDTSVTADAQVEAMLSPYRLRVQEYGAEVIGKAAEPLFSRRKPENGLANTVVDGMKLIGEREFGVKADLAITNFGGLRRDLEEGPITVGLITELSPFENFLVLLEVKGDTIQHIAELVAENRGRPLSGMKVGFSKSSELVEVEVEGRPIDPNRTYKIITIDYLMETSSLFRGREILSQTTAGKRQRDAIIEYFRILNSKGIEVANRGDGRVYLISD